MVFYSSVQIKVLKYKDMQPCSENNYLGREIRYKIYKEEQIQRFLISLLLP